MCNVRAHHACVLYALSLGVYDAADGTDRCSHFSRIRTQAKRTHELCVSFRSMCALRTCYFSIEYYDGSIIVVHYICVHSSWTLVASSLRLCVFVCMFHRWFLLRSAITCVFLLKRSYRVHSMNLQQVRVRVCVRPTRRE